MLLLLLEAIDILHTPFNLTSWGFADCQRDPKAFGFGSTLGRLFLRTLPNNFTKNSVYTFFPLMTPDPMKTNLPKLDLLHQYDLTRPATRKAPVFVNDHATVASILNDKSFIAPYKSRVNRVLKGKGYVSFCSINFVLMKIRFYPVEEEMEKEAVLDILNSPELVKRIGKFFYVTTKQLIASESYRWQNLRC
jgi:linoleate 10R-lipoxygenase